MLFGFIVISGKIWDSSEVFTSFGDAKPVSHQLWDQLLKKHVSTDGTVNYKGFIKDSVQFSKYLRLLSTHHPNDKYWSINQQKAYWINAYNAFTIQLAIRYYPIKSIKDIGSTFQVTFVNTVWDIKFINIEGKKYDLNNIEHGILRKKFDDPRIHFAINCASLSCPKLRNEAYNADKLIKQLDEQAVDFINDPAKNIINENNITISKIFGWFKGDFTKNGSLIDFLNKYSKTKISAKARIGYMEYDWRLNEKPFKN